MTSKSSSGELEKLADTALEYGWRVSQHPSGMVVAETGRVRLGTLEPVRMYLRWVGDDDLRVLLATLSVAEEMTVLIAVDDVPAVLAEWSSRRA